MLLVGQSNYTKPSNTFSKVHRLLLARVALKVIWQSSSTTHVAPFQVHSQAYCCCLNLAVLQTVRYSLSVRIYWLAVAAAARSAAVSSKSQNLVQTHSVAGHTEDSLYIMAASKRPTVEGVCAVRSDSSGAKDCEQGLPANGPQFPLAPLRPREESISEARIGKGSWYHAGYALATTIATPAAYAPLPWAFAMLTWSGGLIALVVGIAVTWYNSILLTALHEHGGKRHIRYQDLAGAILGKWGCWLTIFFQQVASIGNNITTHIVAGQAAKYIYKSYLPEGQITLQSFIIAFGVLQLLLSQLPNIHSLRGLNMLSTVATLLFAVVSTALSITSGREIDRSSVHYGLEGDNMTLMMSAFAALGTIAFGFCDTVLPEIQATVKSPSHTNMHRGIGLAYTIISVSYMAVAITGYWAFGFAVNPFVVYSFLGPHWAVTLALILAIVQIAGCYQIYTRPTYELFEAILARQNEGPWSPWNTGMRVLVTTIYMVLLTVISCMTPFFIDFVALFGAIGVTPIMFVMPVVLYLVANKTGALWRLANGLIAAVYVVVGIVGAVGAFYAIVRSAKTYQLFADL